MKRSWGVQVAGIVMFLLSVLYVTPLLLTVMNAFKQLPEFVKPFYALPEHWSFGNFAKVIELTNMGVAALNSLLVTAVSVFGILWLSSLASYGIARGPKAYNSLLYALFIAGMILPFHVIMVPSIKMLSMLHVSGRPALILMYFALGMSLAVFMFTSFIRSSVPKELEESVTIDGATGYGIYWHIILPLLKPVLVTVGMLNTIWVWNDFLLPSLLLTDSSELTLPLSQFRFVGEYMQQWNYQFAGFTMSVIPIIVLFFVCQKYVVKGITAGALKG
jgi:raffinose/stachyose/melibiose transport system permease protein